MQANMHQKKEYILISFGHLYFFRIPRISTLSLEVLGMKPIFLRLSLIYLYKVAI